MCHIIVESVIFALFYPPSVAPSYLSLCVQEDWQWDKVSQSNPVVAAAVHDIQVIEQFRAASTLSGSPLPFGFGLNGWIIGPYDNRTYFDAYLPADWALGSLDGYLGDSPPDPAFASMPHRAQKWSQVGLV